MCVRDFYEAVARLGGHRHVGPETVADWQNIKKLYALCLPIENEIDQQLGLEHQQLGTDSHQMKRRVAANQHQTEV